VSRTCDRCGSECPPQQQMYSLRIQLYARADPLEFTEDDLLSATPQAFDELIKQLENLDPVEAEEQVHESYLFNLCTPCRKSIHRLLKLRARHQKESQD